MSPPLLVVNGFSPPKPSSWNEFVSALACTRVVTRREYATRDSVMNVGDQIFV